MVGKRQITTRLVQHLPPHPGEMLQELYLKPLSLSIQEAADKLETSTSGLSSVINGNADISAAIAKKLAKVFKTTPQYWLNMQANFDQGN